MRNFITSGDKQIFFESRVDPVKEAERVLSQVDPGSTEIFILFGFTTKPVLSRLITLASQVDPCPFIFCVDPVPDFLEMAREDFPDVLNYPRIRFFRVQEPGKILSFIEEIFYIRGRHYPFHYKILRNLSMTGNWPEEYGIAERMINESFKTLYSNLLVMDRFKLLWMANLRQNIGRILWQEKNPLQERGFWSIAGLEGKYRNQTVLIVNAGPSLDSLHETLRKVKDRVTIMAVDTAVRNLVLAGIEPDIIVSLDSQLTNYQDFYEIKPLKSDLVMEITASHKIPDVFKGPVFFFHTKKVIQSQDEDHELVEPHYRLFTKRFRNTAGLQTGGSVSATAIDLALSCGFSKIILVSLDLAFTDRRLYCRSTYVDRLRMKEAFRFQPYDTVVGRYVITHGTKTVQDDGDGFLRTNVVMEGYKRWFLDAAGLLKGRLFHFGGARIGDRITEQELLDLPKIEKRNLSDHVKFDSVDEFHAGDFIQECESWLNFKKSAKFTGFLKEWVKDS